MSAWYVEAFGEHYPLVYSHRNSSEAREHVERLIELAEMQRPLKVLDLGCGQGRYTRILHEKGHHAIGLDYSSTLLTQAKQQDSNLPLIRGDMRRLPFTSRFDRVLSLFTSFGYFDDDLENELTLREMSAAILPQGLLYLDYLNPETVEASDWKEESGQEGHVIRSKKSIAGDSRQVVKRIEIIRQGEVLHTYDEKVKLYNLDWFSSTFENHHLEPLSFYGNYQGSPYQKDSPRLICLARKTD